MAAIPVSVQLYTLRDLTAKDFNKTMQQVKRIGYPAVELAGFGNLKSAREVKQALDDAGLKVSGNHAAIDALEADLNKVFDENEMFGNRNIICPWMPEDRRKDAAGWKATAQLLTKIGRACRQRGFEFSYHNHSFEFQQFDGQSGFDILWANSDADDLKCELDVYWVKHGGQDPVAYMNALGRRVTLLHLKDMGKDGKFAEVGSGTLDFKAIMAAAEKLGSVKWGVVEQDDTYEVPPLDAIRSSFEHLKRIGWA